MVESDPNRSEISRLLTRVGQGEAGARERLWALVYAEIKAIARGHLAREHDAATQTPTALVHEAFLRLHGADADWQGRRHFFGAAAEAVRRVLVDAARRRRARGHAGKVGESELEALADPLASDPAELLLLDQALDALAKQDRLMAEVFALRAFGGLGVSDVAEMTGASPSTVDRRWRAARAWIGKELLRPG
jgi:RNA polymerase sigma factor (TIGR02999 family)